MKKALIIDISILLLLLLVLNVGFAFAGPPSAPPAPVYVSGGSIGPGSPTINYKLNEYTVATLPSTLGASDSGIIAWVTDGADEEDCTIGGGASSVMCTWNGSAWANAGDGLDVGSAEVVDADIAAAGNGDTSHAYSKDDIHDYLIQIDADLDGVLDIYGSNVVWVTKDGVGFNTIQAAINAITDNSISNKYVILVGPGVYAENVILKPYISLFGVGDYASTEITSASGYTVDTPSATSEIVIRNMTIASTGDDSVSLYIDDGSLHLYDVSLEWTNSTAGHNGRVLWCEGGTTFMHNGSVIYNQGGTSAGLVVHQIIRINGSSISKFKGVTADIDIQDVDDTVYLYNNGTAFDGKFEILNGSYDINILNASFTGVARFVNAVGIPSGDVSASTFITMNSAGGGSAIAINVDSTTGGTTMICDNAFISVTGFTNNIGVNTATGDEIILSGGKTIAVGGHTGTGTATYYGHVINGDMYISSDIHASYMEFDDAANSYIGADKVYPDYFAFANDYTNFWLGYSGDTNIWMNYGVAANVLFGRGTGGDTDLIIAQGDTYSTTLNQSTADFLITNNSTNGPIRLRPDGTGVVSVSTSLVPEVANTSLLGNATYEWADLYLGDGAVIYGQNDQSNTITSSATGWAFNLGVTVPTEVYGAGWDADLTAPTKDAIYDKIEALEVDLAIDDLKTLSGVAGGSVNLGTFTGTIIDDNLTVKAAFQDLETTIEGLSGGHDAVTLAAGTDALTLSTQEITVHAYVEDVAEFTDPNADRLWAWDDSAGIFTGVTIGSGLTLTDTTLTSSGGYTNLTSFVDQTAWRLFYSNTAGDVTELALGADGTYLRSNGVAAAPTFDTPAGSGTVTTSGTPVANDLARFTDATTIEGLTYAELAAVAGFETAVEGVLDLPDLQGAVTDGQVPNNITIDLSALATTLTITDNEATNEDNAILFTSGGDIDGGNLGIESDGDLTYNPSTGTLSATILSADQFLSSAADGTRYLDVINTVAITATATAGRLAYYNGYFYVADGADWDNYLVTHEMIDTAAELETIASLGAYASDILAATSEANFKSITNLEIGTDVQAYDADLTTWAGVTPGTGVGTALAVNIGSAGSVVTNGGAGGTPSSITLTNATGYPAATTSASGISELATTAETTTGTDTARTVTPDGLSGSVYGQKEIGWLIHDSNVATAVGDGVQGVSMPSSINGMNLVDVTCTVGDLNSAASGATTVVLRRVRAGTPVDMTSTGVTISYNEYTASDETIDTANDDVQTGDMIYVDVNAVTSPVHNGLSCTAVFQTP